MHGESELDLDELEIDEYDGDYSGIYRGYEFEIKDNFEVNIIGKKGTVTTDENKGIQEIFSANNDFPSITGGFDFYVGGKRQTSTIENKTFNQENGAYEMQEKLKVSLTPVSVHAVGSLNDFKTAKKIDLTNYERIGMKASTKDNTDYQLLGITQKEEFTDSRNIEKNTTIKNNEITYLDVSELTGEYYIQFGIGSWEYGTLDIEKIWLEEKKIVTSIEIEKSALILGESTIMKVSQKCNRSRIDNNKSKYIISKDKEKYGENSEKWNSESAIKIGAAKKTLTYTPNELGIYYLHVLTVDKNDNRVENVSKNILVANKVFYYGNDDCVETTGGFDFYVGGKRQTSTIENKSFNQENGAYEMQEKLKVSLIPVNVNHVGSLNDFKTAKKIDLTEYKRIGMMASTKDNTDYELLGITQKEEFTDSRDIEKTTLIKDNEITYLDISELTGEYYIQFGIGSWDYGMLEVDKIWAEK